MPVLMLKTQKGKTLEFIRVFPCYAAATRLFHNCDAERRTTLWHDAPRREVFESPRYTYLQNLREPRRFIHAEIEPDSRADEISSFFPKYFEINRLGQSRFRR